MGSMVSNRPETGRTFQNAVGTLVVIALLQVLAAGWALLRRPDVGAAVTESAPAFVPPPTGFPQGLPPVGGSSASARAAIAPPVQEMIAVPDGEGAGAAPVEEFPEAASSAAVAVPSMPPVPAKPPLAEPSFLGPADSPPAPSLAPASSGVSLSDSLREASFSVGEFAEPVLERLVATGVELRSADNMQGALQALKSAEEALPDDPRIMSELAATYRQMGLDEKADSYWSRVEALGEIVGGPYHAIAGRQLRGEPEAAVGAPPVEEATVMRIDSVKIEERPAEEASQKMAARISVAADPELRPEGSDLDLIVYFFDQVDGERIEASTANTSQLFPTEPYDWKSGTEEIVVEYSQPIFTEEQSRELGERVYHGYVIELYYLDRLQHRVVMPPDLETLGIEIPGPLDSGSDQGIPGPENALFPGAP